MPTTATRSLGTFARRLALLAATSLGVVAALAIGGRIVIQRVIDRHAYDSRVVNIAGRQRMLSQRLAKAALAAAATHEPVTRRAHLAELDETTELLGRVHRGLQHGDLDLELPGNASPEVASALRALDPHVDRLLGASRALVATLHADDRMGEAKAEAELRTVLDVSPIVLREMEGVVQELLAEEPTFLQSMEQVVTRYEEEAREHLFALKHQETQFLAALLAVVVFLGAAVLLPAIRELRRRIEYHGIEDRLRLNRALLDATMRERELIGKDLHDGLGQTLAGIGMMARSLAQRLTVLGIPEQQAMHRIDALVSDAIAQTRELSRALHPAEIDDGEFAATLRSLGQRAQATLGVACTVEWEGEPALFGGQTTTHLYRIAQEAISNAVKHGQATHVAIHVTCDDGALCLTITDDGVGFPVHRSHGKGLGLAIMEGRARLLGGRLQVGRGPTGGTRVAASFSRTATSRWQLAA